MYIQEAEAFPDQPIILIEVPDPDGTPFNKQKKYITPNAGSIDPNPSNYRPEEQVEIAVHANNGFIFRIYIATRVQLIVDSALSLCRTIFICFILAMTTLAMTRDAKQLLLNPIERISVKIGKIALNPQEATHVGFEDPS